MQNREGDALSQLWPWLGGAAVGVLATCLVDSVVDACNRPRPPYNHVLTNVERVDEDQDALEVYHDKVRGVTCYSFRSGSPSCVPDIWLTPHNGAP